MRSLAFEAATERWDGADQPPAKIGPNAIIQLSVAIEQQLGPPVRQQIFCSAGLPRYLVMLPDAMVDETEVIALHRALRAVTSGAVYRELAWHAGLLTADYILAHRIPKLAQTILKLLPRRLGCWALTAAIKKHSWTFAGSGVFRALSTAPLCLEIAANPLCRTGEASAPLCDYYAGTFTRLYQCLIDPRMVLVEKACGAVDGGACRFEERTQPGHPGA